MPYICMYKHYFMKEWKWHIRPNQIKFDGYRFNQNSIYFVILDFFTYQPQLHLVNLVSRWLNIFFKKLRIRELKCG